MTHLTKEITAANVIKATPLTSELLHLVLEPEHYIDYDAGQYLKIVTSNDSLCYSIANAPLGSKTYELHIRHELQHPEQKHLLDTIKTQGVLVLNLPFGQCTLKALSLDKPILFIAGGTGFAPIKAMIEQLLMDGHTKPIRLYWSARSKAALYLEEQVLAWEAHIPSFQFVPHITDKQDDSLIQRILMQHPKESLKTHQIVLAGPFAFVYALRDKLLESGVSSTQLFSDAFEFTKT